MNTSDKPLDWINSIAQECKEASEFVQEVLEKYGVQQTPNIGKPKRLIIEHLQFSGQKAGKYTNSFQFEFTKLEPGLWGLFSDGNLKGKTSTLEIIRWLLRGKPSSNFQGGVKKWIKKARIDFLIDDQVYQVDVDIDQTEEEIYGTLKEKRKNDLLEISKFHSENAFETCMSDFMRKQLSLDFISAWRKNEDQNEMGKSVIHNWSALSGILFIGGDYNCLFGDVHHDGLDNRLMNMYLGLPWIPTYSVLKTLEKQLNNNKRILENNYQSKQKQRQERRVSIEQRLEICRSELDRSPLNMDIRNRLNQENEAYLQAQQKVRKLNDELNTIKRDRNDIQEPLMQIKKDLRDSQEAKEANIFFNGLKPTCCPQCQTSISDERRLREIQTHSCSLCGEKMISDLDADDYREDREDELKKELTKLSDTLKEYDQSISSLENEMALPLSVCNVMLRVKAS